jgi:hypothetical protein
VNPVEGRGENYAAVVFIWAACVVAIVGLIVAYIVIKP